MQTKNWWCFIGGNRIHICERFQQWKTPPTHTGAHWKWRPFVVGQIARIIFTQPAKMRVCVRCGLIKKISEIIINWKKKHITTHTSIPIWGVYWDGNQRHPCERWCSGHVSARVRRARMNDVKQKKKPWNTQGISLSIARICAAYCLMGKFAKCLWLAQKNS